MGRGSLDVKLKLFFHLFNKRQYSVVEEFAAAKCHLVMTLRNSADDRVANAGI